MRGDVEADEEVLKRLRALRAKADKANEELRLAALEATYAGTPKSVVARAIGVTRMTIQRWVSADNRED